MAFIRNNNGRRHNNNFNRHRHGHGQQNGGQGQGNNQQRRFVNRANQVFESTGPDGRVRGTAQQLVEKYSQLARDHSSRDDRVTMISYLQHAEHYQRLVNEIAEENATMEREREAYRAQQQASQPEVNPIEIVDGAAGEMAAPPVPRNEEPSAPRNESRPLPRKNPVDTVSDEENSLPDFLQPPEATQRPRGPSRPRRTETETPKPGSDNGSESL